MQGDFIWNLLKPSVCKDDQVIEVYGLVVSCQVGASALAACAFLPVSCDDGEVGKVGFSVGIDISGQLNDVMSAHVHYIRVEYVIGPRCAKGDWNICGVCASGVYTWACL